MIFDHIGVIELLHEFDLLENLFFGLGSSILQANPLDIDVSYFHNVSFVVEG